jgi:hypothetical protein
MTLKDRFNNLVPIEFGGMQEPLLSDCEKIAEEFAIDFAFFIGEHTYTSYSNGTWSNDFGDENLTTKELLEIFKKEKGYE